MKLDNEQANTLREWFIQEKQIDSLSALEAVTFDVPLSNYKEFSAWCQSHKIPVGYSEYAMLIAELQLNFTLLEPDDAVDVSIPEDRVNHPKHYTNHPSGVECIQITEHFNFCVGNAIKYLWRCDKKHKSPITDLQKAKWYIERELARLQHDR